MSEATRPELTRARSLAEMAADGFNAARQKLADLRVARARGDAGAPSGADLAKARDAVELAEDRARLAAEDAAAAERDATYAAALAAWECDLEARRAALAQHHDLNVAFVAKLHDMTAHLAQMHQHIRLVRDAFGLDNRASDGLMLRAVAALTEAWPAGLPLPSARPRHGAADRFVAAEAADLAGRLPLPPRPVAPAASILENATNV